MTFFLSLFLSFSTPALAQEMCPRYQCIAKPVVITRRIHLRVGRGYGDTVQEAGENALDTCRRLNAPGRARYCQVKRCMQNTGPVFPVFGDCENPWQ